MGKVTEKQSPQPPAILMVTGASGVGKTHFVQSKFLGLRGKSNEDIKELLGRYPLKRSTLRMGRGIASQVTWHSRTDGRVAVVGGYAFDGDKLWASKWKWKVPPTGGTDLLIPQCSEYLGALLRGENKVLEPHGLPTPALVVLEACTVAKVNKIAVLDALLDAMPRLTILQITMPRAGAIAAIASRGREGDGGIVKTMTAPEVHDRFLGEVDTIHEKLKARAEARGIVWCESAWRKMSYLTACQCVSVELSEYVAASTDEDAPAIAPSAASNAHR